MTGKNMEMYYRAAAFCLAASSLYIFVRGAETREYKLMDDGSLVDAGDKSFVTFKYTKPVMNLRIGFEVYRSICYGISGLCLLVDLTVGWGHLAVPALLLSAGEIVHDLSDLSIAVFLVGAHVGGRPALTFGCLHFAAILAEILLWFGTCKFHESRRLANALPERKTV